MITFSILVPAHNEEENIGKLLKALLEQEIFSPFKLSHITVVASGCTDKTEDITNDFSNKYKQIRLLSFPNRMGKAHSINLFLDGSKDEIIVMISADNIPSDKYTVNTLLQPFLNKEVGMTCGRPIPLNVPSSLTNRISSLIWHIHHKVSLSLPPKAGEFIAFRNVIDRIPEDTLADEERISAIIQKKNYKIVYVQDAVVYNKAPEKISELIDQRKRIFIGHLLIKKELGYTVPTLRLKKLFQVAIKEIISDPRKILTITPLAFVELSCRILGFFYFIRKRYEPAWKVCKTTKKLP